MKYLLLAFVMNLGCALLADLAFGLSAYAQRCPIDGRESEMVAAYESAIQKSLATLSKKAGFAINPDTLDLKLDPTIIKDDNEYYPRPILTITGTVQSVGGTEFEIRAQNAPTTTNYNGEDSNLILPDTTIIFEPQLIGHGFDKEGNPLQGACRLITNSWFTLRNQKSGKVVAKFTFPNTNISLSEKK